MHTTLNWDAKENMWLYRLYFQHKYVLLLLNWLDIKTTNFSTSFRTHRSTSDATWRTGQDSLFLKTFLGQTFCLFQSHAFPKIRPGSGLAQRFWQISALHSEHWDGHRQANPLWVFGTHILSVWSWRGVRKRKTRRRLSRKYSRNKSGVFCISLWLYGNAGQWDKEY
jgi:hypothetical protein